MKTETLESMWTEFRNDCVKRSISPELLSQIEFAFKAGCLAGVTAGVDPDAIIAEQRKNIRFIYSERPAAICSAFEVI